MSGNQGNAKDGRRPRQLHVSRSFTRLEVPQEVPSSPSRARASTIHTIPEAKDMAHPASHNGDIFEAVDEDNDDESARVPPTFDQLPIEIRSLSERFLKSLSAKTHANPLTIDTIADLFQDFYVQAESHISTHIAALSTRLSRQRSPSKVTGPGAAASTITATLKGRKQSADQTASPDGEQQMLTASEITDRRKARRMLEIKRVALEEAVERAVCEKVYDRLYRHRSADDEERDAKLRSRTQALSLVGIGLKELHVDISGNGLPTDEQELHQEVFKLLAPARHFLQLMDDQHYPLGKLQMLTEAHKSIVETLSRLFPSSSSADEVLPTLIYTLMTSPPETINVISNLHFVQLFRARTKVDGEAAYCLVNLEAAISFLETVDLSSLRADEAPQGGPHKIESRPQTPNNDKLQIPGRSLSPKSLAPDVTPVSAMSSPAKHLPSPNSLLNNQPRPGFTQRRLSSLIQAQADRIEAGRDELLNSADQAFDAINSTLENSFKFLFGRLSEQSAADGQDTSIMPRTLEDARRLVSSPPLVPIDHNLSAHLPETPDDPLTGGSRSDTMLQIVGGRLRERSVDSNRSQGSAKRVAFIDKNAAVDAFKPSSSAPSASAAESMGNLMNSLNPLSRFGGFGKFGRSASGSNTPSAPTPVAEKSKQLGHIPETVATEKVAKQIEPVVQAETDLDALEALATLKKTEPPIQRFLDAKDVNDLRISDVDELLRDYQRLALALKEAVNA